MKKIVFLSLVVGLFFVESAFAKGCIIENCRGKGNDCLGAYDFEIKAPNSQSEAYICERGRCDDGTVILSPDLEKAFICEIAKGWNNVAGFGDDKWSSYIDKINWCSDTQIRMLNRKDIHGKWLIKDNSEDVHKEKTVVNTTTIDHHSKRDSGNAVVFSTRNICFAWTCEYGFVADEDGMRCIKGKAPEDDSGSGGGNNNPCDQPGYERADRNYDLEMPNCGGVCTPIVKDGCYPTDMLDCAKAAELGDPANWNGKKCNCGDRKVWNPSTKRCSGGGQGSNVCAQLKQKGASDERLACCYAGADTMWVGGDKDTDPKLCICVYPKTKTQNPALEWIYDAVTKRGYCKAKDSTVPPVIPPVKPDDEKECRYKFHGEFKCANGTRIRRDYEFILSKEDLKNMTCEKFQERYRNDARGIESLFQKLCLDSQNTEQIPLDAATKRAISNINSFFDISESNRNVWRDEEGQFNTARLASDATAGVVLGTVGGIVSAKVIKKKQLEKGFDVLHCTVGGQKMADYGDTFQVSYQR